MTNTMIVVIMVSRRVGQVTLSVSERTSCRNLNGLNLAMRFQIGATIPTFKDEIGGRSIFGSRFAAEVRCRAARRWPAWYRGCNAPSSESGVFEKVQMVIAIFRTGAGSRSTGLSGEN